MTVTTTPTAEGMPIVEYNGLVTATTIHGVHVGEDIKAMGRHLAGVSVDLEAVAPTRRCSWSASSVPR